MGGGERKGKIEIEKKSKIFHETIKILIINFNEVKKYE